MTDSCDDNAPATLPTRLDMLSARRRCSPTDPASSPWPARMFRLAEFSGAVVVDSQATQTVEAAGLPWIVFHAPAEFIS